MNRIIKKSTLITVLILSLALLVTGCSSNKTDNSAKSNDSAKDKKEITIGFVPMTLNNEYFITMVKGAEQEAAKLGVKLNVQAGQQHGSAEEQLQIVETFIQNKVDAIVIVPSSSAGLTAALKKAQEAGIPIINLDTLLDAKLLKSAGLKTVPFYGTNNYAGAKLAGEYALKLYEGKTPKVAILTGIAGQQNASDRRNGFADAVKGKFTIVAEQSANWEVEQGYNRTQDILQANPDLDLIFASNDGMALGAIRAIKESNRQVKVIGFDGTSEALESIGKNELLATVAQYPAEMGIKGVDAAVKAINGESIPESTDTGAKLISSQNVKEFKDYLSKFK